MPKASRESVSVGSVRRAPRRWRLFGTPREAALTLAVAIAGTASVACEDVRVVPLREDGGLPEAGVSPKNDGGTSAEGGGPKRLVVTADWLNQSLSVLDYDKLVGSATTRDEALDRTIDLSAYKPGPIEVAVTPDGKTAVVTEGPGFFIGPVGTLISAPADIDPGGGILLVDLANGDQVTALHPPDSPMGLAVSPDGKRAFTADHGAGSGQTLSVVDLVSKTIEASVVAAAGAEETSLSPDGTMGVINTDGDGNIRFFDPKAATITLSAPLQIGNDADLAAFVPNEKKLVIAQSLPKTGYTVVDLSDPANPTVLDGTPTVSGVAYGANLIPGTSHVLVTTGVGVYTLVEVDVSVAPSVVTRTIQLPVTKGSLPLSTAIDPEGKHAFVGVPGENVLVVVDLSTGDTKSIPWLANTGPTRVAIVP